MSSTSTIATLHAAASASRGSGMCMWRARRRSTTTLTSAAALAAAFTTTFGTTYATAAVFGDAGMWCSAAPQNQLKHRTGNAIKRPSRHLGFHST